MSPRNSRPYRHDRCGSTTVVSEEHYWMVHDPFQMVSSTYCCGCKGFVSLDAVAWTDTGERIGAYRRRVRSQRALEGVVRLLVLPFLGAGVGALIGVAILATLKKPSPVPVVVGVLLGGLVSLLVGQFASRMLYAAGTLSLPPDKSPLSE